MLGADDRILNTDSEYANTQLLNAVAVLFGIGMLSEPLAFAYAGWIGGSVLIVGYGLISCYTCVPPLPPLSQCFAGLTYAYATARRSSRAL